MRDKDVNVEMFKSEEESPSHEVAIEVKSDRIELCLMILRECQRALSKHCSIALLLTEAQIFGRTHASRTFASRWSKFWWPESCRLTALDAQSIAMQAKPMLTGILRRIDEGPIPHTGQLKMAASDAQLLWVGDDDVTSVCLNGCRGNCSADYWKYNE